MQYKEIPPRRLPNVYSPIASRLNNGTKALKLKTSPDVKEHSIQIKGNGVDPRPGLSAQRKLGWTETKSSNPRWRREQRNENFIRIKFYVSVTLTVPNSSRPCRRDPNRNLRRNCYRLDRSISTVENGRREARKIKVKNKRMIISRRYSG